MARATPTATSGFGPLLQALRPCRRILLSGPVNPDGDSIGACLAFQAVLRARGHDVWVAGDPGYRYHWMPEADAMLPDDRLGGPWDAVVIMDGDRFRLEPGVAAAFAAARVTGLVDHHTSTTTDGYTATWFDPVATSTCQMVYEALPELGLRLDATVATWLYVGAIFDTGAFRYSNTTPATHRMAADLLSTGIDHAGICVRVLMERRLPGLKAAAAVYGSVESAGDEQILLGRVPLSLSDDLGLVPGDLEGIVDAMLYTVGVEIAVLLIERPRGVVKVSLRSRGRVDVAEVARRLTPTGGGHKKAAGASLTATLQEACARTLEVCVAALTGARRAS